MGSLAQRLGQRAKILLLADGLTPKAVSKQLQDARSLGERSVPTSIDLMSLKATIYFYHDDFLPESAFCKVVVASAVFLSCYFHCRLLPLWVECDGADRLPISRCT